MNDRDETASLNVGWLLPIEEKVELPNCENLRNDGTIDMVSGILFME